VRSVEALGGGGDGLLESVRVPIMDCSVSAEISVSYETDPLPES
jgi:hypothetical protein